jgi:hypothetical protein
MHNTASLTRRQRKVLRDIQKDHEGWCPWALSPTDIAPGILRFRFLLRFRSYSAYTTPRPPPRLRRCKHVLYTNTPTQAIFFFWYFPPPKKGGGVE